LYGFSFYLLWKVSKFFNASTNDIAVTTKMRFDNASKLLIIIAVIFVFISFSAPFLIPLFLKGSFAETSGHIGDTVGGLMNPFIALSSVIVTGLAFYIQYKANEQQRIFFLQEQSESKKQFDQQIRTQKFESQFYELLKLHRENVAEMVIGGYDFNEGEPLVRFEKETHARKVFVTMKTEFECILSIYKAHKRSIDIDGFIKCYDLFFFGLDRFEEQHKDDEAPLIKILKKAQKQHQRPDEKILTNMERKKVKISFKSGQRFRSEEVELNFNYKPFSGHSSLLGHYFRHLFMTVKSIVYSELEMSYDEKMKYLKMLRAQLSNHEQVLLYYNWLGGFGDSWEDDTNKFFTEYKMIHNLWYRTIFNDPLVTESIQSLKTKRVMLRKSEMFEADEV